MADAGGGQNLGSMTIRIVEAGQTGTAAPSPMSTWSISTRPLLGCSRRLMVRISEDLPAPLRPIMPNTSPRWIARSMPCKACSVPS